MCISVIFGLYVFFFSSRRRHTRCALVTGVQTCALPICEILGKQAQPVTDLPGCKTKTVLVTAFDAGRLIGQVQHLLPKGAEAVCLDTLRLPDAMLTTKRNYLDSLNFATNLVLSRAGQGHQIGHASCREGVCQYV